MGGWVKIFSWSISQDVKESFQRRTVAFKYVKYLIVFNRTVIICADGALLSKRPVYQHILLMLYTRQISCINLLDPEFLRASNICLDRSSYNGPCNKNG